MIILLVILEIQERKENNYPTICKYENGFFEEPMNLEKAVRKKVVSSKKKSVARDQVQSQQSTLTSFVKKR